MTVEDAVAADPWCQAERHGTRAAYVNDKCRCTKARRECARYENERVLDQMHGRPRMVDATGTKRRIRALMRLGWTKDQIGREFGSSGSMVKQLLRRERVYRTTAERVAAVYDRLSMTLPPETRHTADVRRRAEALGYAPPLAWDDDTIDDPQARPRAKGGREARRGDYDEAVVDRLVREGKRVRHLTRAEAVEAVRRLRRAGVTDWQLEEWYGFESSRYPKQDAAS